MQRIERAMRVAQTLLKLKDRYWVFRREHGIPTALITQDGWNAMIWVRPRCACSNFDRPTDAATLLERCRDLHSAYVFDLWLDGVGKVLSAEYDGTQFELISFRCGAWENDYFGLPSPERPVSSDNMTVHQGQAGGRAPGNLPEFFRR